ncbi:putative pyridine nucleotide-disulfide oxidoreductase [Cryphonectria parasitica EP155]|uniref:Pyridine nucleotide-disulfide oxidoreductase n=1 Tax=Cryphonectria parasitica (strain ATCC 38755 / EP155) TaxID=660469 RepID=A0A9P5CKD6_CRYP1|nr:putative pyridine nucleotide-disulfide oxidoreductase [Cryphonectria parasitica EP155]KAF3762169.1 putative pyridine nucleotide-disulfide oxidoreductase [Cryphonectria parasitica EP155]
MGSHFDASFESATPFRVLILGGSYGGLSTALSLVDLAEGRAARTGGGVVPGHEGKIPLEVTIVDERDGYYHLIGSPLALADEAYASKAWVKYTDITALQSSPKISVLRGTVQSVHPATKTATVLDAETQQARALSYDYLAVATGLRRAWPVVPQSLLRKQYLVEARSHIDAVGGSGGAGDEGVVVVGGGAVGIEMAAELKLVRPEVKVTLVHSHDRLLSSEPLPDECKARALELVREAGVEVLLGKRVAETREKEKKKEGGEGEGGGSGGGGRTVKEIVFTDGETMDANVVIMAISRSIPSTAFLPQEVLVGDDKGLIKVRPNLMFAATGLPNADCHFAVGDAIRWSGIKRCGAAMHMGFFAAHNIHECILYRMNKERGGGAEPPPKFQELDEIPPMIGLAVGKKAMSYSPAQGVASGEDVMKAFFGNDLGFDICWNYMKLGEPTGTPRGGVLDG